MDQLLGWNRAQWAYVLHGAERIPLTVAECAEVQRAYHREHRLPDPPDHRRFLTTGTWQELDDRAADAMFRAVSAEVSKCGALTVA